MEKIKDLWENIGVQFVKFGLVGASNTVISFCYLLYICIFGLELSGGKFWGICNGNSKCLLLE